jgi:ribosomal protein S18 acetylase RimI-like enzyme
MKLRSFRIEDAPALATLAAACARSEKDFVLNPMWEGADEVLGDFERRGIDPVEHLLVADDEAGALLGMAGFLRRPAGDLAGLICPIVSRRERGRGLGGELLRAAITRGLDQLGIKLATAGIGARNHAGYALLAGAGFRPVRQHVLMRCDERPKSLPPPVDDVVFEPARTTDADAMHAIYESCGFELRSLEATRSLIGGPRHAHAVAREREAVVGFVELETHWPRRPWVAYVGVVPGLRDRGVGSGLVGWALGREFDAGAATALLMLSPANRTAFRAYEKVGFRRFRVIDVLEKRL